MSISDYENDYLSPLLGKYLKKIIFVFLIGDFNIKLLKTDSSHNIFEYYNNLCSYCCTPLVLQPIRVLSKN